MKALLSSLVSPSPIPVQPTARSLILPPVVSVEGKIDLDYCALLFFDRMVLDKGCFDSVTCSDLKALEQLKLSMNLLCSEGLLEPVTYTDVAKEQLPLIINGAQQSAKEFQTWLPALKTEVAIWREIRPSVQKVLDPYYGGFGHATYGVAAYLFQKYGEINKAAVDALDQRILKFKTDKKIWTNEERETLSSVIRPVLECVNLNLVVAEKLNCRNVFDWSTLNHFYKTKYLVHLQRDEQITDARIEKTRELFNVAFPQFLPQTAKDWLKFISNGKVVELRKRIDEALTSGTTFDSRFAADSLNELLIAERRAHNLERIIGWATIPMAFLPGGHFIQEGILEGIGFIARKNVLAKHAWMYFCSVKKHSI